MKIVIVNKSDSRGGAAVVSYRLMEALRQAGADARMLVVEKLTDSPYVEVAASPAKIKESFLKERLGIFLANGLDRRTLFKIDTASCGLPLWRHPLVERADAVLLNWVNQGMLSLKGVRKILAMGKPVVWTMHDMWCMTGICHHAGECGEFKGECAKCSLLRGRTLRKNLARSVWRRKEKLYSGSEKISFVAVSNWLSAKAKESSLLSGQEVSVIPNAFPLSGDSLPGDPFSGDSGEGRRHRPDGKIVIAFGAARIDDPIKGLPVLVEMSRQLRLRYPELASATEIVTFGDVKHPESLSGMCVPHRHLGMLRGGEAVRKVYEEADIVVSASSYETLPGTLVEAQAYGCIPLSFNQGGQSDIIDHLSTGYIAEFTDDVEEAASRLADGVAWAASVTGNPEESAAMRRRMLEGVIRKFSPEAVAQAYLSLIEERRREIGMI